jgi:predicted RNA-binding Zn-ribbon protein involved in translation (DUF1610 family)
MQTTKMLVLKSEPKKGTRTVLVPKHDGPVIEGTGDTSYVCGNCGYVLLDSIDRGQVQNMVIKCKSCGAFNGIPS